MRHATQPQLAMHRLTNAFRWLHQKINRFILACGRLIGVKQTGPHEYDARNLSTAIWVFILGIPIGFLIAGIGFNFIIWGGFVGAMVFLVNIDGAVDFLLHGNKREA